MQDSEIDYHTGSKTYISARENLNQTQIYTPNSHMRGSSTKETRPQKLTIDIQNEKKQDSSKT
jgi:hypothetical protein